MVKEAYDELVDIGFKVDALMFHQGETDAAHNISKEQYIESGKKMIGYLRDNGIKVPLFIAIVS